MPASMKALDEVHVDALREVANVGTGHAVTALSEMTGGSFIMSVPEVGVQAMDKFADVLGDAEALAVAIYMPVDGDAPGHAAFLLPFAGACELTDLLLGLPVGETTGINEMACSALTEIGNILIGSFLNALSEMTGLSFPVDPPGIAMDMTE